MLSELILTIIFVKLVTVLKATVNEPRFNTHHGIFYKPLLREPFKIQKIM